MSLHDSLDDHHLTVEFSESVSLASSNSTGSKHSLVTSCTNRQKESINEHRAQIRKLYIQFSCGSLSANDLCEGLSNFRVQVTARLNRELQRSGGSNLKYTQFLLALNNIEEEDLESIPHFKESYTSRPKPTVPFGTLDDILDEKNTIPVTPKRETKDSDVLNWSTPSKDPVVTGKKSVKGHIQDSPLATMVPKPYEVPAEEEEEAAKFTVQERNALIQAFLGSSISSNTFLNTLEIRCNITPSETLHGLIAAHAQGRSVRYLDLTKEITFLLQSASYEKIKKVSTKGNQRATVNIFDMASAPEVKRVSVPHSKEQHDGKRTQRDLFTWEGTEEERITPSRKIGTGVAYSAKHDIYDQSPMKSGEGVIRPARKSLGGNGDSDIFSWSTPPKQTATVGKKQQSEHGISAIPWGTDESFETCEENPHAHRLSKRAIQ